MDEPSRLLILPASRKLNGPRHSRVLILVPVSDSIRGFRDDLKDLCAEGVLDALRRTPDPCWLEVRLTAKHLVTISTKGLDGDVPPGVKQLRNPLRKIGRASCRERV